VNPQCLPRSASGLRSFIIPLGLCAIGMALLLGGCRRPDTSEATRLASAEKQVRNSVETLSKWSYPGTTESLRICRETLRTLEVDGVRAVTTVPSIVRVAVGESDRGHSLVIYWLERESDLAAVRVREYWPSGDSLCEIYPIGDQRRQALRMTEQDFWAHATWFAVAERRRIEDRKDEEAWRHWAIRPHNDDEHNPPMLLARPSETMHVLISLIDECGNEGRAVPLTVWIDKPPAESRSAPPTRPAE